MILRRKYKFFILLIQISFLIYASYYKAGNNLVIGISEEVCLDDTATSTIDRAYSTYYNDSLIIHEGGILRVCNAASFKSGQIHIKVLGKFEIKPAVGIIPAGKIDLSGATGGAGNSAINFYPNLVGLGLPTWLTNMTSLLTTESPGTFGNAGGGGGGGGNYGPGSGTGGSSGTPGSAGGAAMELSPATITAGGGGTGGRGNGSGYTHGVFGNGGGGGGGIGADDPIIIVYSDFYQDEGTLNGIVTATHLVAENTKPIIGIAALHKNTANGGLNIPAGGDQSWLNQQAVFDIQQGNAMKWLRLDTVSLGNTGTNLLPTRFDISQVYYRLETVKDGLPFFIPKVTLDPFYFYFHKPNTAPIPADALDTNDL